MPSSRTSMNRTKSDARRTLFRSLNSNKKSSKDIRNNNNNNNSSSSSTVTGAQAAASSSRACASTLSGHPPLEDDDDIIVRNHDGSIDVQLPSQTIIVQSELKDLEHDNHRLAELVKRHNSDMARKLPEVELLRRHVASLANDNWMFETEDD